MALAATTTHTFHRCPTQPIQRHLTTLATAVTTVAAVALVASAIAIMVLSSAFLPGGLLIGAAVLILGMDISALVKDRKMSRMSQDMQELRHLNATQGQDLGEALERAVTIGKEKQSVLEGHDGLIEQNRIMSDELTKTQGELETLQEKYRLASEELEHARPALQQIAQQNLEFRHRLAEQEKRIKELQAQASAAKADEKPKKEAPHQEPPQPSLEVIRAKRLAALGDK